MRSSRLHPHQGNFSRFLLIGILLLFGLSSVGCEKKSVQRLTINDDQASSTTATRTYPCNVLIVGEDWLKEPLQRQWSARQDSDFEVQTIPIDEFAAANFEIEQGIDVVIYPTNLMIELIHRGRITKLNRSIYESESFNKNDVLTHFRKSGIRYDSETWAVPCGGSIFALLYQPQALIGSESELPETWSQLIRLGERLNEKQDVSQNTNPSQGIAVPLSQGWAAKSFIAIAAPYARKKGRLSVLFERRTMKPLIASEAFVRALEELKSLAKLTPESLEWSPQDILQQLVEGKLSAGMTWPNNSLIEDLNKSAVQTLRVHSLPGSNTYFDESTEAWGTRQSTESNVESNVVNLHGMNNLLASQTKISRRPQSAVEFLKWLSESTISQTLFASNAELGPFRVTHLGDAQAWIGDQFSVEFENSFTSHLKEAHDQPLIMTLPNILRQSEYIAILDTEIRKYLKSDLSAKETLEKVAQQWEALTDSIGRKTQSNILRRNSNF